jgi:hypothetical protein
VFPWGIGSRTRKAGLLPSLPPYLPCRRAIVGGGGLTPEEKGQRLLTYLQGQGLSTKPLDVDFLKTDSVLFSALNPHIPAFKSIYEHNQIPVSIWKEAEKKGYLDQTMWITFSETLEELAWNPTFRDRLWEGSEVAQWIFKLRNDFYDLVADFSDPPYKEKITFTTIKGEKALLIECNFTNKEAAERINDQFIDTIIAKGWQRITLKAVQDGIFDYPPKRGYLRICYQGAEIKLFPLHALPKYKNLIKKFIKERGDPDKPIKEKEQEGKIGLWKALKTWKEGEGSFSNWAWVYIQKALSEARESVTTTALKKERRERDIFEGLLSEEQADKHFKDRILKESIESSGGSLDEPLKKITKETLPPEEQYVLLETYRDEPEMKTILWKKARGETLTDRERQIYRRTKERFIKKHQEKKEK